MIVNNDYTIEQYVNENKVVITLPQTLHTLTNTVTPVAQRRIELSDNELAAILVAVKAMYEGASMLIHETGNESIANILRIEYYAPTIIEAEGENE